MHSTHEPDASSQRRTDSLHSASTLHFPVSTATIASLAASPAEGSSGNVNRALQAMVADAIIIATKHILAAITVTLLVTARPPRLAPPPYALDRPDIGRDTPSL